VRSGLSPRTVHYTYAVLRSALAQAARGGLVHRNVAALVRPPRAARREAQALTAEEAQLLLDTARGTRYWALWVLALTLGLRRGELLGLRWADLDLDRRTVRVTRSVQRIGGRLVVEEVKSETSRRTLPLPRITLDALREHRTRQHDERAAVGDLWQDHDLVFPTSLGTSADPRNLRREFVRLLVRAGVGVDVVTSAGGEKTVPRIRLHDLRHTCASLLLAQGVPARVVMEILGHSGIAITMNIYAHVLPTLLRDSVEKMDDLFA
jgi:integrase